MDAHTPSSTPNHQPAQPQAWPQPAHQQHPAHPPQSPIAPQQGLQPQPQQGYQPQPQGSAPMGCIRFTTQGGFMTASMIRPNVTMNGYAVAINNYGTTDVPVPAGVVNVEAHMTYIWGPYGRAGLQLQVQPGQIVPVFYAQPYLSFGQGRMGVEPQERQGKGAYIAILSCAIGVPLLIIAFMIGLFAFMG